MSNHEFENYMALVSRLLRLNRAQEQMIRDELQDHLEFRVADLVETGTEPNEAVRKALEEFGDAASLAQQFQSIFKSNQKRWIMRFATFSIAGSFVAILMIFSMWPSPARFGAPGHANAVQETPFGTVGGGDEEMPFANGGSGGSAAVYTKKPVAKKSRRMMTSEDIDAILNKPITFQYDEIDFQTLMDELRQNYEFNVHLDHSAQDDSLTRDTLITFNIRNVRMSTALRLLLHEHNATYVIDDGVMQFISMDVATDPQFHRRKVFDCRKLLMLINDADPRIGSPLLPAGNPGGGFGGGGGTEGGGASGGGLFCVDPQQGGGRSGGMGGAAQQPAPESFENLQQYADGEKMSDAAKNAPRIAASYLLMNLIRNTVVADEWNDTNGDGTLEMIGGLMVVNQTEEGLDQIERLLDELERQMRNK